MPAAATATKTKVRTRRTEVRNSARQAAKAWLANMNVRLCSLLAWREGYNSSMCGVSAPPSAMAFDILLAGEQTEARSVTLPAPHPSYLCRATRQGFQTRIT